MIRDIVVSLILSDKGSGPKIYQIFKHGRLEEFLDV